MKTALFFDAAPEPAAPAARPVRRPYHDNPACPEGQQVRQRGLWQLHEPTSIAETGPRCSVCRTLATPAS